MSAEERAELEAELEQEQRSPAELGERLAEMVEREAVELEREPEPDPDEDEPDGEPAPEEPSALELAAALYVETVLHELGPEHVTLCTYCAGRGYNPLELSPDPHAERCPGCNGKGATKLPTDVTEQAERLCVDCNGKGWRELPPALGVAPRPSSDEEPSVPIQWLDEVHPGALPPA